MRMPDWSKDPHSFGSGQDIYPMINTHGESLHSLSALHISSQSRPSDMDSSLNCAQLTA